MIFQAAKHTQADHEPGVIPEGRRTPGPVNCPVCRPAARKWDRDLAGKAA